MPVIVRPRNPGVGDYLGQIAMQLAGGAIQGMFERDAAARQIKNDERAAASQGAQRQQQIEQMQQYGAPLGQEAIAQSILGLLGANTGDINNTYEHANPHMTQVSEDLGDRQVMGSMNPKTGQMQNMQMFNKGVSPTQKYQSDATTKNAGIAAGASRYATDGANWRHTTPGAATAQPRYGQPVVNEAGEYVQFDTAGNNRPSGVKAPPKQGQGVGPREISQAYESLYPLGAEKGDPNAAALQEAILGAVLPNRQVNVAPPQSGITPPPASITGQYSAQPGGEMLAPNMPPTGAVNTGDPILDQVITQLKMSGMGDDEIRLEVKKQLGRDI